MKRMGFLTLFGALAACALYPVGANAQSTDLPEGAGKSAVVANCAACHGLNLITAKTRSADEWEETLNRMIANGVTLDESQYDEVLAYLQKNLSGKAASGTKQDGKALAHTSNPKPESH